MNTTAIQFLFDYNEWANARILAQAGKLSQAQLRQDNALGWGSFMGGLAHVMAAESAWVSRLFDEPASQGLAGDDFADVAALQARWTQETARLRRCLDAMTEDDLARVITRERGGWRMSTSVREALQHLMNHGTQHRAECAALLTGWGHSPGDLDMTVYISQNRPVREGGEMTSGAMQQLYAYNEWANARIFAQAAQLSEEQLRQSNDFGWGSLFGALVHTLDAEYGWRKYLQDAEDDIWLKESDFDSLAALRERWEQENAALQGFVRGLSDSDLQGKVFYEVDGEERSHVIWHCLAHVANHGTQHRAECAALLTNLGHSPGDMDMMLYLNLEQN